MAKKKRQRTSTNITGMRGVFLAAAKLSELGFVVSPTLRNAAGADLLVTDKRCRKAFTVQVKTSTSRQSFFLIGKKVRTTVSPSHFYVLVDIRKAKDDKLISRFYVLPSKVLARDAIHRGKWPNIKLTKLAKHEDAWSIFGRA